MSIETAIKLRTASQKAAMSSPEPWETISERRRDQWIRMSKALNESGERIVSVAELQIQRMSLIAFRDQHAATVVNIQINQRNGDVTEQQIDEWRQNGMDNWKQRYPRAAEMIDRITALIGDDAT